MPQVVVPPPYRGSTLGEARIPADGSTLRECFEDVGRRYPGFIEQIFDGGGKVHKFVDVFVNGEEIDREDVDSGVAAEDCIEVLAAVAGG
ncbi:MAG: MoaD/ThiS family protein [Myxococcota bacterium]|jgi:sulfur carrier protein ThiS|nr:molybdopterin synthase sulfur carrier subunit [Deltaproteobacteria bacterium]MCP4242827.1 MoaD/ThiS family protein [bacterium]MDP6075669.1 MoaD/ThiS family protein [Myxococcota bacterium]MDP6243035.1 MoaD/ThiS family protein [Myxococcota bacterium]MDP7075413.1 MoaD/ThiS family protein [Myxococcota bacterium]